MKVFPICYFPPVHWYVAAMRFEEIWLDGWQPYRKQQFTSRTHILTSNRVLPLTIPVERRSARAPIKEKRISYAESWQRQHWRSLVAAYSNSPYFEYYCDRFEPLFQQPFEWLIDLLWAAHEQVQEALRWEVHVTFTQAYQSVGTYGVDYRDAFDASLRQLPDWFEPVRYPQVFDGFQPGLSILDLLCNEGPQSSEIIRQSWNKEGTDV